MTIQLRDYQKECIEKVSAMFRAGAKSVLLQKPTGSGKTRTASYVVESYSRINKQVLWLVHREELLMQAAMTFAEYGISHRMICSKSSERAIKIQQFREFGRVFIDHSATTVIASIQTIVRRLDSLPWLNPAIIIPDECHLSLAETWRKVIARWEESLILGLTATPCRLDKKPFARNLGGLYDQIVIGPRPSSLIEKGHLAKYKLFAPIVHFDSKEKIKIRGGDFDAKELEQEFNNVVYGDVVSHYRNYADGTPAIAFCPTVKIAQSTAEAFIAAGYRAISIDGQTDDAIRRKTLQQLGNGEIDVVTSVSILVEGTDVPFATTALLLRKTQSLSLYLQAVGRVLRPHPKKPHAIIIDCVGVSARHGFPDDDFEWTLDGEQPSGKERKNEDDDVTIRKCPKCACIHRPAPVCESCGHVYEKKERKGPNVIDAIVEEIDIEAIRQARIKESRINQGKAQTVDEMVEKLGYSRGRAEKVAAAREAKAKQVAECEELAHEFTRNTGLSTWRGLGVNMGDIKRMKPKELTEFALMVRSKINGTERRNEDSKQMFA